MEAYFPFPPPSCLTSSYGVRRNMNRREWKMKALFILITFYFSIRSFADTCEVKTILAENTKVSQSIFSEIKKTILSDSKLKNDLDLSELSEPRDNVSFMYIADINNDSKKEYVFTSPGSGSGGFINIFVFIKDGNKFVYLGAPPKPKGLGDGPWYFKWHLDSKTSQIKFLVNGCDSTYMQFDLGPEAKLERYFWKNGQTERVTVK